MPPSDQCGRQEARSRLGRQSGNAVTGKRTAKSLHCPRRHSRHRLQSEPELLGKFVPAMANAKATVGPGSHGDGLLMGWALGADLKDMPYIKATYGQYPEGNNPNAREMVYYAGAIIVNKAGERFVDESINYKAIGDVALLQDDGVTYQIYDEKIRQYAHETRTRMGILEGEGMVCEADTLEELAAKVGISPSGLVATVEEYNKSIKQNGYDTKFPHRPCCGSSAPSHRRASYYAFPSTGVILAPTASAINAAPR